MSGWTVPPSSAVPPSAGLGPPPGVGMEYRPEEEDPERAEARVEWAEAAAEADEHKTTEDLVRDAAHTRDRVNQDVAELRHKLGIDDEAKSRRMAATGPLAPVRRHPFTVVMAAVAAATATIVGLRIARGHRKEGKAAMKAAQKRRKAASQRIGRTRDSIVSAASDLPHRSRGAVRRLTHH